MQKQEIVRKESKKFAASKIDIISFIAPKKIIATSSNKLEAGVFSEEIGPIDSESILLLEKLVNFVDKDELFNLLATKPLKSKISKKAVRLMVIPNSKDNGEQLRFSKKK